MFKHKYNFYQPGCYAYWEWEGRKQLEAFHVYRIHIARVSLCTVGELLCRRNSSQRVSNCLALRARDLPFILCLDLSPLFGLKIKRQKC